MDRARILTSPVLIAALGVLLLNDFVLKHVFHNWLTGKTSDFAGLFLFPLFLSAFAPGYKLSIYVFTAVAFVFWKSTSSQWLIDWLNALNPVHIGRTPDVTDLIAILVLPASWMCASMRTPHQTARSRRMISAVLVSALCLFAFVATSTVPPEQTFFYDQNYEFDFSRQELQRRFVQLDLRSFSVEHLPISGPDIEDIYYGRLDNDICASAGGRAKMRAHSLSKERSSLRLVSISYNCSGKSLRDQQTLLEEFERRVIDKLRTGKN